ncbi:MAG: hypothetical protein NVS1B12_07860 [Acidimicrobiales bacterium]
MDRHLHLPSPRPSRWRGALAAASLACSTFMSPHAAAADTVSVSPTANGLTFGPTIQHLLNWTAQGALWASLGSILVGAGMWGLSKHFGNYGGANKGLQLVIGGAVGALVVATAPAIVNTMFAS